MPITKFLILGEHAAVYRDIVLAEFPDLDILTAAHADWVDDPSGIDAVIGLSHSLSPAALASYSRLRWIQALSSGVDGFIGMVPAGVTLTSMRGIHGPMLREFALLGMLALTTELERLIHESGRREWNRRPRRLLWGKTVVLTGTGAGGTALAKMFSSLEMHVVGISQTPRPITGFAEVLPRSALKAAVERADFIVNVLPGAPQNTRLFDQAVFAAVRTGAIFVNLGRGQSVDEPALVRALDAGRVSAAALDVFGTEPLPQDSALWGRPNVLITPHIAGYCQEYEQMAAPVILRNIGHFLRGDLAAMENRAEVPLA